jgi:hypothetical protein
VLALAALPTLVSWALEQAGMWGPSSSTRAWLAVPFGAVLGVLLASVACGRVPVAPRT